MASLLVRFRSFNAARLQAAAAAAAVVASLGAAPAQRAAPARPAGWKLTRPTGLLVDPAGNLFVTDIASHQVLRLSPGGAVSLVAGAGHGGFSGDGGPAARSRLFAPHDLVLDAAGSLLIADTYNHRIRKVDRRGVITTLAGNGAGSYSGDNGPAAAASLNNPQGLAAAPDGSLYIADTYNHVVRKVDRRGIITTFAGSAPGLAGDGGPAAQAQLSLPTAVAPAADGAVYISDGGNNRIRRVRPDGIIETLLGAGPGTGTAGAGFAGDGGPVLQAKIFGAADLLFTPTGDLLLSDSGNHRIRKISNGIISTIAGCGIAGSGGDGGSALQAMFNTPQKLALGKDGTLYIADRGSGRVRRIGIDGRIDSVSIAPRPSALSGARRLKKSGGRAK